MRSIQIGHQHRAKPKAWLALHQHLVLTKRLFHILLKDYKLALKNLTWVYLNKPPHNRVIHQHLEAAFIWFKNNKLSIAEGIIRIEFKKEPRYKNIFDSEPLKGTLHEDGSFKLLDYIESDEVFFERDPLERIAHDHELMSYKHR